MGRSNSPHFAAHFADAGELEDREGLENHSGAKCAYQVSTSVICPTPVVLEPRVIVRSVSFATRHDDIAALMHTELFADSGFYS